jgi:hypothetical protein
VELTEERSNHKRYEHLIRLHELLEQFHPWGEKPRQHQEESDNRRLEAMEIPDIVSAYQTLDAKAKERRLGQRQIAVAIENVGVTRPAL